MQALSNAYGFGRQPKEAKNNEYLKEVIEIGEALSAKANDQTTMYWAMYRLCFAYKDRGEDENARRIAYKLPDRSFSKEKALLHIFVTLLFEDGDYGSAHRDLYSWHFGTAMEYAQKCDTEAVILTLHMAAEHIIAFEQLEENTPHTSLLFNTAKTHKGGKTYMHNEPWMMLDNMAKPCFDFCRGDERFAEIERKLKAVASDAQRNRPTGGGGFPYRRPV